VEPWAQEIFAKFDSRLTEDISGYKERYDYISFVLKKEDTYVGIAAEAIRRSSVEVPLPVIAFDVLADSSFVKKDGFLFMQPLDIDEDYPVIFRISDGKLKGFQLVEGGNFPAGTVIHAYKSKSK
jgi:hypothetical protein